METSHEKPAAKDLPVKTEPPSVVFAQTGSEGMTIGVLSSAEPSSLALLAAGVAGLAARRARRERKH